MGNHGELFTEISQGCKTPLESSDLSSESPFVSSTISDPSVDSQLVSFSRGFDLFYPGFSILVPYLATFEDMGLLDRLALSTWNACL